MSFGLKCFRSVWGTPSLSRLETNLKRKITASSPRGTKISPAAALITHIKAQGYDGIEASLNDLQALGGHQEVCEQLQAHDMQLVVGIYSGWVDYEPETLFQQFESVQTHVDRFHRQLEMVQELSLRPVWINAHSGSDHWDSSQRVEFIAHALELAQRLDLTQRVCHETHRGRVFYSPWTTLELLEAFPSLQLTLDFSHWCVVTERLLDTCFDEEWLRQVLPHVRHVHGRIGTAQHPQIRNHLEDMQEIARFDALWRQIWHFQAHNKGNLAQNKGNWKNLKRKEPEWEGFSTFTPEYGPLPYARRDSGKTEEEIDEEVDALCVDEANRQRASFHELFSSP